MEDFLDTIKETAEDLIDSFVRHSPAGPEIQRTVIGTLTVLDSIDQSRVGHKYSVYSLPTYLGRAADNDVILPDASVSRSHARIAVINNKPYLQDLGSRFGTYLNGEKLKSKPAILVYGDKLQLGRDAVLEFSAATRNASPEVEYEEHSVPEHLSEQITLAAERDSL